jgi:hypothetical protein
MPAHLPMPDCLNCQQPLAGPYCHQCGQATSTQRFAFGHLASEVWASFTNLDRGLWATVRGLTLRPATTIGAYLDGRRATYYNWLKYLLLMVGLATLVTLSAKGFQELYKASFASSSQALANTEAAQADNIPAQKFSEQFQALLFSNYNLVYLAFLPFITLFSHWLFRGRGRHLAEHLVIQAYLFAHYSLFYAVLFGAMKPFEGQAWYGQVFGTLFWGATLAQPLYNIWAYVGLFPGRPWATALRSLAAVLLGYLAYVLLFGFVAGIYVGYMLNRAG